MAELSGLEVLVLAKEIDLALRGTYVNNIYRFGPSQLIRLRRPGGDDTWLVVSPAKGVWISGLVSERTETTEFTSKLRSELERARFSGASQYGLDRVFLLDFAGEEKKRVIVEMMPPGNIIVTGGDGRIRLALSEVRSPARRVVRGGAYEPPRQTRLSPLDVSMDDIAGFIRREETAGKTVGRHISLPRKYVAEALAMLGVAEASPSKVLEGREDEVVEVLREMVETAKNSPEPCICQTDRGDEIFVVRPRGLVVKDASRSISELTDRLFLSEATTEPVAPTPEETRRKELEATITKLKSESRSLIEESARFRALAAKAQGASAGEAVKILKDSGARASREPTSSAAASSVLFDWAKALEAKSAESLEAAARLEKKSSKAAPARPPRTRAITRRKGDWFERFRWFITGEGRLAVGGRDAQSNSVLLRRHLDPKDTVYHADLFGSPFFVLKGGEEQGESDVLEVAQATVAFSSAWKTGLGAADAYWVRPLQIDSAAPSGEYLSRGSYAIRGKKNYVSKLIVELALGVDSENRVMSGSEGAVKKHCRHYVVLRPHNEKGSETAKKVLKELGSSDLVTITLEEVQRALPAGGGKIIRRT